MRKLCVLAFAGACSLLTACASVGPVGGFLYADVQGPVAATSNPRGNAKGEACATSFFGIVGLGDASITAAAKKGKIDKISHVEQHSTNIIGYMNYCTMVWGWKGAGTTAAPAAKAAPAKPAASDEVIE